MGVGGVSSARALGRPAGLLLAIVLILSVPSSGQAQPVVASGCPYQLTLSGDPLSGPAPLLVHFNASVSSGVPSYYDWNFTDGSYWNVSGPGSEAPLHRYATAGSYRASVGVAESGCATQASALVTVGVAPLVVTVHAAPASGAAPLTVVFNATISGGSGTYLTAVWSFGDGGVGSGLNVAYTYRSSGSFEASLNVTDSAGRSETGSSPIVVEPTNSAGALSQLTTPPYAGLWAIGIPVTAAVFLGVGWSWARRRAAPATSNDPPEEVDAGPRSPGPTVAGDVGSDGVPGVHLPPALAISPDPPRLTPSSDRRPARVARPVAPDPEADSARLSGDGRDRLRLTHRVILHLGGLGLLHSDDIAPVGFSQSGMAAALGARQNSLTNVLRRLVAAGVLTQELRHVQGQPRRLRVYRFTARGEAIYLDLRKRTPRSRDLPRG